MHHCCYQEAATRVAPRCAWCRTRLPLWRRSPSQHSLTTHSRIEARPIPLAAWQNYGWLDGCFNMFLTIGAFVKQSNIISQFLMFIPCRGLLGDAVKEFKKSWELRCLGGLSCRSGACGHWSSWMQFGFRELLMRWIQARPSMPFIWWFLCPSSLVWMKCPVRAPSFA